MIKTILQLTLILGVLFTGNDFARAQTATTLNIFVATGPSAADTNSGLFEDSPVATLAKAHSIASTKIKSAPSNIWTVQVYVRSGTYWGQTASWTAIPSQGSISIIGYGSTKPIFDGRINSSEIKSKMGYFLNFAPGRSGDTNFKISNLQVQYYLEAITLRGTSTSDPTRAISKNVLEHCTFSKIGDAYATVLDSNGAAKYGMAVVRLLNTKNSRLHGNDFIDIKNTYDKTHFHAFYNAHYSSSNVFEGNKFLRTSSGAVVRFRDYSNENLVQTSHFESFNAAPIQLWHCESAIRTDCTKKTESPSYNTRENKNRYVTFLYDFNFFEVYQPYAIGNPQLYTNAVYGIIEGTKVSSGYLTRSNKGTLDFYGFCSNATSCINQNGACFANGYANTTTTCQNSDWFAICPLVDVNKHSAGSVCQKINTTTAVWKPLATITGKECSAHTDQGGGAIVGNPTGVGCLNYCDDVIKTAGVTTYTCSLTLADNSKVILRNK